MKVVLDTNVLLSAFLTDGICARILKRARNKEFTFIFCASVLKETQRLLKDKFTFSHREIAFFISILLEAADDVYQTQGSLSGICRDPNDDMIIACAVDASAEYIVTGDEDLLILKNYKDIVIMNPRNFEALFED